MVTVNDKADGNYLCINTASFWNAYSLGRSQINEGNFNNGAPLWAKFDIEKGLC